MLDVNLYTISFVKSANEEGKLAMVEEGTGDPVYYRLRTGRDEDLRLELYHALTHAGLATLQNLSSKLKLISLQNPSRAIELRNSGYINWEWTFEFDQGARFCWRRDIVSLTSNQKGFTCWMVRKPDPDYPCAIYRPASSSTPPSCQLLDFNIRRIENLEDRRGLEIVILLSLLAFTESLADYEARRQSGPPIANQSSSRVTSQIINTVESVQVEPNEILITETGTSDFFANAGLKLLSDPLLVYIYVHAPTPSTLSMAVKVAETIKRARAKRYGEVLQQYVVDDIMSRALEGKKNTGIRTGRANPSSLKIYLSRTPLDELLPQASKGKSKSVPPALPPKKSHVTSKFFDQQYSSDESEKTGFRKRLMGGVVRRKTP